MVELYAVTDDTAPPPPPLRAVGADGLTAVVGPAGPYGVYAPELRRRHDERVEALMERRTLVPVPYGTRLPDDEAVVAEVAARRAELLFALARVRGAVELTVRAVSQEGTADALDAILAPAARASKRLPGPELLRAAYLVDREAVPDFIRHVEALRRPGLDVRCTGPSPPYSFTDVP